MVYLGEYDGQEHVGDVHPESYSGGSNLPKEFKIGCAFTIALTALTILGCYIYSKCAQRPLPNTSIVYPRTSSSSLEKMSN